MFNVNSSQQIAGIMKRLGLAYPLTDKGNPAIDHQFLEFYCDHPIAHKLLKIRSAKKVLGTFFEGSFTEYNVAGRIHPNFLTMRSDEGGAVTGRLSCQNPNLQQVPSKDDKGESVGTYGTECRSCFIPEEGCFYGKIDYSQIEYRCMAHYAIGDKSDEIKRTFNDNPHTDYHALVQSWIKDITGIELDRKFVKNLNFGTMYYMGVDSMSKKFGWPHDQSKELNRIYFETFPFLKPTRNEVVNIVDAWNASIFTVLVPHITVHDELGVSIPKTLQGVEAYRELKHVMENVVKLKVPIIAEAEIGPSWGETEACDFDKLKETL